MNAIATEADVLRIENQGPPADLPASTYEMIGRGAAINPTAPALSFFLRVDDHRKPLRWTYAELLRDITRTANMLSRLGVDRHSVVAYVLPNLPETHFVIWGGEAAGIVCAINPLLEGPAIASLLKAANAKVLVTLAPFPGTDIWSKIQPILSQVPSLQSLVLIDLAGRVHGWRRIAASVMRRRECKRLHGRAGLRGAVPRHIAIHDFDDAMSRESGDSLLNARRFDADDISSYFCTGGTTGLPKIAIRRHGNEVANAWSVGQVIGAGMGPGKTVFCGLPLFHVNAVLATGLVPFSRGAHVVLGTPQGYRGDGVVKRFWEIVEHHRINFFSAVPTLYSALLDVPVGGRNIGSLEYGLCGAAPMPVEVFRTFQDRTGVRILEGYGLTEGACVSSVNPPGGERRLGSIGLCIPGQMMKAVILDDAGHYVRDCVENEVGLLTISGPNVFEGYLQEDQNKGLWLDLDDGRQWLNTGDLARRDAQGYFWLTGRRKELIIRGGHNIDPATIEEPLHRHPAVQIAAAIGRPDVHAGELPVAYVQLKAGATATEAELDAFIRGSIGERAAIPKRIHIVDAVISALRDAGVEDARVSVADDQSRGLALHVALHDHTQISVADTVMGRFPFEFSISVEPGNR